MKWKAFFKRQANNPKYLRHGDVVELVVATDDGAIDLGTPAHHREVRVTLACRNVPSSSSVRDRPASPRQPCWRSTAFDCLVLDRWPDVYPQPRAVHLDDEIYRIVARLGIADEFAAISRPAHGLRLLDNAMRVLAEFRRDTARSVNGFPQANMFDQPEFEALLRNNLKRYPHATLRGDAEVTDVTDAARWTRPGHVRRPHRRTRARRRRRLRAGLRRRQQRRPRQRSAPSCAT